MKENVRKRTYWCDTCHVPLIEEKCLACGSIGRDICSAKMMPVFDHEIQYLKEQVPSAIHHLLKEGEIWVSTSNCKYFCQGIPILKLVAKTGVTTVLGRPEQIISLNRDPKEWIETLRKANFNYLDQMRYEAEKFIRKAVLLYKGRHPIVSFSGGKDSTVVSHLVMSALWPSTVIHIFADTTIEFPDTYEYLDQFNRNSRLKPFVTGKSKLDFFKTAKQIGPPSRILRWCCSTHKTTPLAGVINDMGLFKRALTFDGIRKTESTRRAGYTRIRTKHKIAGEILARPIIEWSDLDVWIYLVVYTVPFNRAYKYGFRRVGCLHCPFNSGWSQNMLKYWYPTKHKKWQQFLINQAKEMSHSDPENFADQGWRVRAGGRGLDHYKTTLEKMGCDLSYTAVMYQLVSGDIYMVPHFLRPLGPQIIASEDDFSLEFFIHDLKSSKILAGVCVKFKAHTVRVDYLKKPWRRFQQRIEKQLKKLQTCIFCGSCAAKCKYNAIETDGPFIVDQDKCIGCLACVKHKCPALDSLTKTGK